MANRNLLIVGIVVFLALLTLSIWNFSDSSPVSAQKVDSGMPAEAVVTKPLPQSKAEKSENLADRPTGPVISDLLTDKALSESAVRDGLSKIALDKGRKAEERNEALSHLLNLSGDAEESELLALVLDRALNPELARRVFEDAFNRPHSFQADLCLELMTRKDALPLVDAAREHLLFLLGPEIDAASDMAALKVAVAKAKKNWAEQAAE